MERDTSQVGDRYDLFISYARRDSRVQIGGKAVDIVAMLKKAIERHRVGDATKNRRVRVCTDLDDFSLGSNFDELLSDRIERSKAFLLICSPNARARPHVAREIATAAVAGSSIRRIAAVLGDDPNAVAPELFSADDVAADLNPPDGVTFRDWQRHVERESHKVVAAALDVPLGTVFDRFQADRRRIQLKIGLAASLALSTLLVVTAGLAGEAGYHRVSTLPLPDRIVAPAGVAWTAVDDPLLIDDRRLIAWRLPKLVPQQRKLPVDALYVTPNTANSLFLAGPNTIALVNLQNAARSLIRAVPSRVSGIAAASGIQAVATEDGDLLILLRDGRVLSGPRPFSQRGRRFRAFRENGPYAYGGLLALHLPYLASVDDQGRLAVVNLVRRRFVMPAHPQFPLAEPIEHTRDPILYETDNTRPIGALAFTGDKLIFGDGDGLKSVSLPRGDVRRIDHCALDLPRQIIVMNNGRRLAVLSNATLDILERVDADGLHFACRQRVSLAPHSSPRAALAPDGKTLLISYFDGQPDLWRPTYRLFGMDVPLP